MNQPNIRDRLSHIIIDTICSARNNSLDSSQHFSDDFDYGKIPRLQYCKETLPF